MKKGPCPRGRNPVYGKALSVEYENQGHDGWNAIERHLKDKPWVLSRSSRRTSTAVPAPTCCFRDDVECLPLPIVVREDVEVWSLKATPQARVGFPVCRSVAVHCQIILLESPDVGLRLPCYYAIYPEYPRRS